jgi:predicted nucleic acid-binding protein
MGDVHDIRIMRPDLDGRYMLDTNVVKVLVRESLEGLRDIAAGAAEIARATPYERFVLDGKRRNCTFYVSMLTFSEFAAYVENTFRRAYDPGIEKKAYRTLALEREKVRENVRSAWEQVAALAEILPCEIDADAFRRACAEYYSTSLDPYDALIRESMRGNGLSYIVTDDRDFASATDLIVYTVTGF